LAVVVFTSRASAFGGNAARVRADDQVDGAPRETGFLSPGTQAAFQV